MTVAFVLGSFPIFVLYATSLVLVIWTVIDVARRSPLALPSGKKAAWIIGSIVGWLLFGAVGAIVAILYLLGPRRRMNAERL
ncbi:MAG: hypothetical protein ACLPVF_10715 [Acidimicrobiales bacterium]